MIATQFMRTLGVSAASGLVLRDGSFHIVADDENAMFVFQADAALRRIALLPGDPEPQKTGPITRVLYADQPTVPKTQAERLLRQAFAQCGTAPERTTVIATGYGRNLIAMAQRKVTEITCHARGVFRAH